MPNAITEENSIDSASDIATLESGNLTSSGTLSGTEIVPVSKGGLFQTTVRAIAAFTNQLVNPTTLNVTAPLTGTEVAAVSQGGSLLQATLSSIAGYINGLVNPANLNAANALTGSELVGINQSNSLVKLTVAALTTFVLSQQATASTLIQDTGTANAYQAANPTPLTTSTWVTGTVQQFVVANTNTGASTYAPDGLSPIPILGEGFLPLVGGELLGNCVARLRKLTIPGVNSGNPFCVLIDCTGAVKQVTPGTASSHTATFGQVTTAVNASTSALTAAINSSIAAATGTITTAYTTSQQTQATNVGIDTGTANAYVVAYTPALGSPIPWVPFWFEVKTTNTGASTLNATGTAYPLLGGAHLALQGGEMVSGGNALVYWNPTLNAGVGCYVLLFCSGGCEQVVPAIASGHAVQFSQLTGLVGAARNLKCISLAAAAAAAITFTADQVIVGTALGLQYSITGFNGTVTGSVTGIGGIDTGTIAPNTSYAFYAAFNPTTKTSGIFAQLEPAGGASNTYTGAFLPAGYVATALIGCWITNSSSQFIQGFQLDRQVTCASLVSNTYTAALTNAAITLAVPKSAKIVNLGIAQTTATAATQYAATFSSSTPVNGGLVTVNANIIATGLTTYTQFGTLALLTPQTCYGSWVVVGGSSPQLVIVVAGYTF
jgi:hypothetical protein